MENNQNQAMYLTCNTREKETKCQKDILLQKIRRFIEKTNSWHNGLRNLHVRYEKKAENYLGLAHMSFSIII